MNYCLLQFIFQIHFSRLNFVLYLIKLDVLAEKGNFLWLHWVGAGPRSFSVYSVKEAI